MSFHWLLAAIVAAAIGAAASAWLWLSRRPQDEAVAGLASIAGMRWREFSRFVLDAMRHRGYEVDPEPVALTGTRPAEFVMHRDGRKWLLGCRHGEHAGLEPRTVHALENALLANGAAGAVLVATSGVGQDARRALASLPRLQLLEGQALWRELAPMLPESLRDEAATAASRQAGRGMRLAWLAALVAGVAVGLVAGPDTAPTTPAIEAGAPVAEVPAPAAPAPAPAPTGTPARETEASEPAPAASSPAPVAGMPSPTETAFDRSQVALAVAALPGITDAAWVSDSTLLVHLPGDADEHLPAICGILEGYPSLRASRLQLQPPPDSGQRVRFRQCQMY